MLLMLIACTGLWQCPHHRNALNQEMGYDLFLYNTKPFDAHSICVYVQMHML